MRDNSLARYLIDHGHDVTVLPTYLPHFLDEEPAVLKSPIFFGGINVYLQHKFPIFRKTPKWIDRLFDSQGLLRWAANRKGMTTARELGEITLSTFRGKNGPLAKEVDKVTDWFRTNGVPDVLLLSTVMLAGVGRVVSKELKVPALAFLQGEDGFLDSLLPEFREEAWNILGTDARNLDGCISPSFSFAKLMSKRLQIPEGKIYHLPNGISMNGYSSALNPPEVPTLGYFARLCPEKGLDLLIDAFVELKKSGDHSSLKLSVAGTLPQENKPYLEEQKRKISAAGLSSAFEIQTNLNRIEKINFLQTLSLFCVPARIPEAFGLYVIEAMAAGIPVVLPDHGSFPEIIKDTGGGLIYPSNDPSSLTKSLTTLLTDSKGAHNLGQTGREEVRQKFSNEKLANFLVNNILAPILRTD